MMLQFVNIETLNENTDTSIRSVLKQLHPRFTQWLKDVYVSDDTVTLCYNFNHPTERILRQELAPLLQQHNLSQQVDVERVRQGVPHASAVAFLDTELKPRCREDNYITDVSWLGPDSEPFISYLSLYRLIHIDRESEVIGLDYKNSKLWCRQWIVGIAITEDDHNELQNRWAKH